MTSVTGSWPRRRWARLGAALLGSVVALGACAVGPDFVKPEVTLNQSWQAKNDPRLATQTATDSLWWKAFNDPALDRLVELAYRQNLPLQISGLRIVEARAQLGIATGRYFPQVQTLSAGASRVRISKNAPPLPNIAGALPSGSVANVNADFWDYQVGFDAVWEIDFWGKYRRGVESGAAKLLSSVADYYSGIVSLTAEVARSYAVIRTYQVLIELARGNIRIQEEGLGIAEARFTAGATSELDVAQASTLLESTRASLPQLEASVQQARNALSTLLGQPTGSIDNLLAGPTDIPRAPRRVAVSVPAEMLRRRPDIRRAELQAAAQCARIGVAKADLYPSFTLIGSIGFEASANGTAHNLFAGDSLFYSIGPRIVWPFFNYGRITNAVRVEDARFQQSLVAYRQVVLQAAQEVEDALSGFLRAQEAVESEQRSVIAAQKSVQLALVQYREGAVDYQRVLDAQRSLLQEQNTLAQLRSAIATSLIAVYKALGGGWEPRQGEPVVPESTQKQMRERTGWGDLLSRPRKAETTKPSSGGR